ncbi:hypothetical protein ACHAP5_008866 [Fusarium lateritium]
MVVTSSAASAISAIERTCSVPSLLGSLFIIFTFCSSKLFHKPISRMLFYASFGNMMSNVATLMSQSFTDRPNSAGCQTQAFLIETLIILLAFTIYVRVGFTIYKWRRRLNGFSNSNDLNTSSHAAPNPDFPGIAKTTDITITTLDSTPADFGQPSRPAVKPEPVHLANIYAGPAPPVANPSEQPNVKAQHSDRRRRSPSDEAAVSYAKVALLFFTAMLITWIPASANRLYILIAGHASEQLGYVSAFVLPLQGFWNALIYYYTSRAACKQVIASIRTGRRRLDESDPNGSSFADRMNAADDDNKQAFQLDEIRASKRMHDSLGTESTESLTTRV